MKKIIYSISLLITFSLLGNEAGAVTLKPSLQKQISINEQALKSNLSFQKKVQNLSRLAELKRKIATKKSASKIVASGGSFVSQDFSKEKPLTPSIRTISSGYISATQERIPGVDIVRVREAWFGWYNEYRRSLGLGVYAHDPRLDRTANDWNLVFSASRGQNHHERNPGDGYYNFPVIDRWFMARGIDPKVINRAKHTENDGYGYYRCTETDCTDELIASIRTTWNYFLGEKGKSYDAHYRTIIQPHFTKMGFDIMVKPEENRYYMVIHFTTE